MKKLEHRLTKSKDEARDAKRLLAAMMEKYPWIAEDRQHFGVEGSNYDYNAIES